MSPSEPLRHHVGRLVEHGAAPYQFQSSNANSYFVKLDTEQGPITVWGLGLKGLVRQSQVQGGELIELELKGKIPVQVLAKTRNAQGAVVAQTKREVLRNEWRLTRVSASAHVDAMDNSILYAGPLPQPSRQQPAASRSVAVPSPALSGTAEPHTSRQPATLSRDDYELSPRLLGAYVVRQGRYLHPANEHDVIFEDKGHTLTTSRDDQRIVADMVEVARIKGWTELALKGTESFRRSAWLEAEAQGLHTRGYQPSEHDRQLLTQRQAELAQNRLHKVTSAPTATESAAAQHVSPPPATRRPGQSRTKAVDTSIYATLSPDDQSRLAAARLVTQDAVRTLSKSQQKNAMQRFDEHMVEHIRQTGRLPPKLPKPTLLRPSQQPLRYATKKISR